MWRSTYYSSNWWDELVISLQIHENNRQDANIRVLQSKLKTFKAETSAGECEKLYIKRNTFIVPRGAKQSHMCMADERGELTGNAKKHIGQADATESIETTKHLGGNL